MTVAPPHATHVPTPLQAELADQLAKLEQNPHDATAWRRAAAAMVQMGHVSDAVEAQRRAVALLPADADVAVELGRLLSLQGVRHEPEQWYRHALKLDPTHREAHIRLGLRCMHIAELDEATEHFAYVLDRDASDQSAIAGAALVLDRQQRSEEAWALLERTMARDRPQVRLALAIATVGMHVGKADVAVDIVRKLVRKAGRADRALLLHSLGDLYDTLGDAPRAWSAWTDANAARALSFDAERHDRAIDALIEATSHLPPPNGPADERPVFVVGMPRTGTTMLESMLDAHPDVAGVEKLETLRDLALALPRWIGRGRSYLEVMGQVPEHAPRLGQAYLDRIDELAPGARRVVDKMPNNALHLALVGMALPGARIIWCERDPDDVALSCFQQSFGAGLAWSSSLEGIRSWQRGLDRLREHWERVLPQQILRLKYEDMVTEPEAQARRVAAHLGVPYRPEMLAFHTRTRPVKTASWDQVNEPLHRRRIGRSAPYLQWLKAS